MLRRLLMLLLFGGVLTGGVMWWRRWQATRAPSLPSEWRELAASDAVLAEALDLWDRLCGLANAATAHGRALLRDAREVVAAIAALGRLQADVADYLRTARSSGAKPTATLDALEARRATLVDEGNAALAGLRQIYLQLLDGKSTASGVEAAGRAADVLDSLRNQANAEAEIRAHLSEL